MKTARVASVSFLGENVPRVVAEEAGGGGAAGAGGGDEEERVEGVRSQLGGSRLYS